MDKPVRDYYEVLGVEKTASGEEIKRAYFGKVRQYPPERFPEEFKELRAAYDTLSDVKKRGEYDESGALPEAMLPLLYQGRKANKQGHYAKAAEFYETILHLYPELDKVRQEYAWNLEDAGKTGKAAEVWQYLCEQCPANAEYALALAESYGGRGWGKKAIGQYRRALELDRNNSECWLSFIHYHIDAGEPDKARTLCAEALDAVGEKGDIRLYFCAFGLCEGSDDALAERSLQNILRTAQETPRNEAELGTILFGLIDRIDGPESIHFYPYIKKLTALQPASDDAERERLARMGRNYEITTLEENGFDTLFYDIFFIQNNGNDSRVVRNNLMSLEYNILSKKDTFYPQLVRLKEEYPDLYDLHKNFFDEALTTTNPEKLMARRVKALAKQNLQPAGYTDGEEGEWAEPVQTIRRESPKVGRNDPCPCGSGKKYKTCCGA
jgi:curved DNA-binding protein CbpA